MITHLFSIDWNEEIHLNIEVPYGDSYIMMLHQKYDLPIADIIHPMMIFDQMASQKLIIRNKHFFKTSTKSKPCLEYWPKVCWEIQRQDKITKEYNCHVPIFFTEHLTKVTKYARLHRICFKMQILKLKARHAFSANFLPRGHPCF